MELPLDNAWLAPLLKHHARNLADLFFQLESAFDTNPLAQADFCRLMMVRLSAEDICGVFSADYLSRWRGTDQGLWQDLVETALRGEPGLLRDLPHHFHCLLSRWLPVEKNITGLIFLAGLPEPPNLSPADRRHLFQNWKAQALRLDKIILFQPYFALVWHKIYLLADDPDEKLVALQRGFAASRWSSPLLFASQKVLARSHSVWDPILHEHLRQHPDDRLRLRDVWLADIQAGTGNSRFQVGWMGLCQLGDTSVEPALLERLRETFREVTAAQDAGLSLSGKVVMRMKLMSGWTPISPSIRREVLDLWSSFVFPSPDKLGRWVPPPAWEVLFRLEPDEKKLFRAVQQAIQSPVHSLSEASPFPPHPVPREEPLSDDTPFSHWVPRSVTVRKKLIRLWRTLVITGSPPVFKVALEGLIRLEPDETKLFRLMRRLIRQKKMDWVNAWWIPESLDTRRQLCHAIDAWLAKPAGPCPSAIWHYRFALGMEGTGLVSRLQSRFQRILDDSGFSAVREGYANTDKDDINSIFDGLEKYGLPPDTSPDGLQALMTVITGILSENDHHKYPLTCSLFHLLVAFPFELAGAGGEPADEDEYSPEAANDGSHRPCPVSLPTTTAPQWAHHVVDQILSTDIHSMTDLVSQALSPMLSLFPERYPGLRQVRNIIWEKLVFQLQNDTGREQGTYICQLARLAPEQSWIPLSGVLLKKLKECVLHTSSLRVFWQAIVLGTYLSWRQGHQQLVDWWQHLCQREIEPPLTATDGNLPLVTVSRVMREGLVLAFIQHYLETLPAHTPPGRLADMATVHRHLRALMHRFSDPPGEASAVWKHIMFIWQSIFQTPKGGWSFEENNAAGLSGESDGDDGDGEPVPVDSEVNSEVNTDGLSWAV